MDFIKTLGDLGTAYLTGQSAEATAKANLAAQQAAAAKANTGSSLSKYLPWIIGGGVLLVVGVVFLRRK